MTGKWSTSLESLSTQFAAAQAAAHSRMTAIEVASSQRETRLYAVERDQKVIEERIAANAGLLQNMMRRLDEHRTAQQHEHDALMAATRELRGAARARPPIERE